MLSGNLLKLYGVLRNAFGPRGWWPADTPWEVMVGAILTQNTAWKNVELALSSLKSARALEAPAILALPEERLQGLIRPAGYFRQKSARLRRLAAWWIDAMDCNAERLADCDRQALRASLLELHGVGRETADSILLYAAEKPAFVVDAYTARVCVRHGLIDPDADYETIQALFEDNLPADVELYKDFHAQLVEVCKRFCRKRPLCEQCPVRTGFGEPLTEYTVS